MASDLEHLLRQTSSVGTYILVAHSIGGFVVRVFAERNPGRVAGMVLIDSAHPNQADAFAHELPSPNAESPAIQAFRSEEIDGWRNLSNPEGIDLVVSAEQVRATKAPLPFPIRVISAGRDSNPFGLPQLLNASIARAWNALQRDLAGLSRDSVHRTSPIAGHFVQEDDPDLVAAQINELIRRSKQLAKQ
jgi:pimeloyl-ACP methyl ester carboxylesterase